MILITGGTGRIGRMVLEMLAAADLETRALVRDLDKARALDLPTVEFVRGDLADTASLAPALAGIDRVVLISTFSQDMVQLQTSMVEAAARAPLRPRIVKLSSLGADPDSPVPMFRWHGGAERAIEQAGLPWTFIRPTYFMQNALVMAGGMRKDRSFALPASGAAVAQVDTRDIAAVILRVLIEADHEGKSYDLTGPEPLTWFEVAGILSAVAGGPISYEPVTPAEYKRRQQAAGMPAWMADAIAELLAHFRAGGGVRTTDHIRSITNQAPRSYSTFARDHAHAFRLS